MKTNNKLRLITTLIGILVILYAFQSIPVVPGSLSKLAAPLGIDLKAASGSWIKAVREFDYTEGFYTEKNKPEDYPPFLIAYGIFNLGDYCDKKIVESGNKDINDCLNRGIKPKEAYATCYLKSFREKVMYPIYKSPELQKTAYNWLLPEWKKAFTNMPAPRKKLVSQILNHMITYTTNLDYQKELNFFNQCKGEKEFYFTTTFPIINGEPDFEKGTTKPYRKTEAWVFRRIHQKQMTKDEITTWLRKIKKDFIL